MHLAEEGFYEADNLTIYVIGRGKLRKVREFEFRILIDTLMLHRYQGRNNLLVISMKTTVFII